MMRLVVQQHHQVLPQEQAERRLRQHLQTHQHNLTQEQDENQKQQEDVREELAWEAKHG